MNFVPRSQPRPFVLSQRFEFYEEAKNEQSNLRVKSDRSTSESDYVLRVSVPTIKIMMNEVQAFTSYEVGTPVFMDACEKIENLGKKKKCQIIRDIAQADQLAKLSTFLTKVSVAKDVKAWNSFSSVIEAIMKLCRSAIENSSCRDVTNRDDFRELMRTMKKCIKLADEKKKVCRSVLFEFVELEESYEATKTIKKSTKQQKPRASKPLDDFRSVNLLPTKDEVNQNGLNPVSPVIVKGPYDNVEHYLSSQFRLLREDYVEAIRAGLNMYREALNQTQLICKYRYESIRLYSNVRFEKCKCSEVGSIAYKVNFDPNNRITVDYQKSRIFMHGSLLLFSRNEFQTFFCASIFHHDVELLNSGKLYVTVEQNGDFREELLFLSNVTFTMIESDVFWEPYFLVLQVLKGYTENSFPMARYLIDVSSEVDPPSYLHKFPEWDVFGHKTKALDFQTWPAGKEVGLDDHQFKALKTALTKEFCVIQGPPGTGKTFLGLKIVEILLTNMNEYEFYIQHPILIICFTNHALDQFLEGILEFDTRMIRFGGQSRSERLNRYNFKEKKALRKAPPLRETAAKMDDAERKTLEAERKMRSLIGRKRREMHVLLFRIDQLEENLEILDKPKGILSFDCLEEVIGKKNKEILDSDYALTTWLLDEKETNFPPEHKAHDYAFIDDFSYSITVDDSVKKEIFGELFKTAEDDSNDGEEEQEEKENPMTYTLSLNGMGAVCLHYKKELDSISNQESMECTWAKRHLTNLAHRFCILEENLDKTLVDEMLYEKTSRQDLLKLPLDHRWNTYFYWIEAKKKAIKAKINRCKDQCRLLAVDIEKYQLEEDASIMASAAVVGMTTTGGARCHAVLEKLKPSVVIVEEAAEVLEAHIVASLTKHTKHVILIGDHKQLKPSTAVYELSKTYNLDCSLFERMINNGMFCPVLKVQHRMRPEISSLISPSIYKKLQNHESVQKYESIKGVSKNVFFVDHSRPENAVEDSTSYMNVHEAEFIIEFCIYLIDQGYNSQSITLLTTYAAQMQFIKQARTEKIGKVRVCVVDEYQGEENDIIILSLVRSNAEGNIGFLKIENRVCVALSRAKKGFYMIGNMSILSRSSPLWQKVNEKLAQNNGIGPKLTLRCSKHGTKTEVACGQDFSAVRGGGCNLKCGDILPCTHVCTVSCHIADPNHEDEFACKLMSTRTLECGHTIMTLCSTKDYLCREKVAFKSPTCKHTLTRECFNPDTSKIVCENYCKAKLRCAHECPRICHLEDDHALYQCQEVCGKKNNMCKKNHTCQRKCFENCGECSELETFLLGCGHITRLPCSTNTATAKCPEICGKVCTDCGKPCQKQCWEECKPCLNEVKKMIWECSHFVNIPCSVAPTREVCKALRTVYREAACGHDLIYGVPCGISHTDFDPKDYLLNCEEECSAKLYCQHECSGTCGQCMQGRLHVGCKRVCGLPLICGHQCNYPCVDVCPPCCEYSLLGCSHTKLRRRCGALYTKCQKRCTWKCKHSACTMACGDFCNRDPCYKPCPLTLNCGHPCAGFCGEPCPRYCPICDEDADAPKHARYVSLEDCLCDVESHAFEAHLDSSEPYVEMYRCPNPNCEKVIVSTKRFMNRIKNKYKQIVAVFKKVHSLGLRVTSMRGQVIEKLKELCQFEEKGLPGITKFKIEFLRSIYDKVDIIDNVDMAIISYFSDLFNTIGRRLNSADVAMIESDNFKDGSRLLSDVLDRVELKNLLKNKCIMVGLRLELIRMHRVLDYCILLREIGTKKLNRSPELKEICETIKVLIYEPQEFSFKKDRRLDELFEELELSHGHYSFKNAAYMEIRYTDFLEDVSIYNWQVCANKHLYQCSSNKNTYCPEC